MDIFFLLSLQLNHSTPCGQHLGAGLRKKQKCIRLVTFACGNVYYMVVGHLIITIMVTNGKRTLFSLLVTALLTGVPSMASAQFFMSGGLGFNVLSADDHTVEVTVNASCTPYQGNISIPATVVHDDVMYDVVALGESAFADASLSGITIPPSITAIRQSCFFNAHGLNAITIPASVTEIGMRALAATGLAAIQVDTSNPCFMSIDGILYSKDTATLEVCPQGKSGSVVVPSNTKHIAPCAFFDCKTVTGVALPEGLKSIGFWAFMSANHLNNVVIPSTVTTLGDNLFGGCSALSNLTMAEGNTHYYMDGMAIYSAAGDTLLSCHKSGDSLFLPNTLRVLTGFGFNNNIKYVHVPEGVSVIGDNAFSNSSLKSIDLPSHLDRIDAYAFDYCISLTHVAMPATLGEMGKGCFELCIRLTSIDIPDGLHTIPFCAFMYCTALSQVGWGEDVETIDIYAFGNCALKELLLPSSLRVVRTDAFWKGPKMNVSFSAPVDTLEWGAFREHPIGMLRLRNIVPPVTTDDGMGGGGCLSGTTVQSITIPCGSLDAYQADAYWCQFGNLYCEDEDCGGIGDSEEDKVRVYSTNGHIVVEGADGEVVRVFDMAGRILFADTDVAYSSWSLPTGVYLVKVGSRPARKLFVGR